MGAALATLAAARFASTSPSLPIAGVYSFGGLQVGNAEFRKVYDDVLGLGDKTLRFVYWKDLVPMLPPPSFGFVPVGRTVVFPEEGSCEERKEGEAEYDVCASEAQACTKESPAMAPVRNFSFFFKKSDRFFQQTLNIIIFKLKFSKCFAVD